MGQNYLKSPEQNYQPLRSAILGLGTALSMVVYLLFAQNTYRIGFPLDDAWIHQTYARNFAYYGEWSFFPGQASGGSTSPLWSMLLSVGYFLRISPYIWTYLIGGCVLWTLSIIGDTFARTSIPSYKSLVPWVGLFFIFEWHLVWAAASGMETILYALLVTIVLGLLMIGWRRYIAFGLLIGVSVWVRPDGITLLAPVILYIVLVQKSLSARFSDLVQLGLGFGVMFAFYLLFNLWVAGTPWPNTFYAKQAEYADLLASPLLRRITDQIMLPLIGAGVVLLPGAVGLVIYSIRKRLWATVLGMIWFLGYLGLYALRLPVTYQHGRYIMPAMPIFFLWGLIGYLLYSRSGFWPRYRWISDAVIKTSCVLVLVIFWFLGASSYGQDVAFIESEMVTTAVWINENIPPDELIAAHDIGALGYFAQHQIVDLAGLVSPDVISFIRDEQRLGEYLNSRNVNYLVVFPDWYPMLVKNAFPVYKTQSTFSLDMGGENMVVYEWNP